MSLSRRLSGLALIAIVMAGGLMPATSAKAEDLVDFLWGGSPEYGGGRSVVSFDPQYKPGQIIVSFSDRRLYWIMKPAVALTYPVAIPTGEARWQGVTSVTSKRVNPSWTPTPEMVRANPRLPRWVPGGHPMNPLGIRAMYLGSSAYRIHGTDAPWTIGQAVSHGCIRMTNEDVLDLYPRIPVGTRVTVTWQQFRTQTISDGSNLERYTDKDSNPNAPVAAQASAPQQTAASEAAPTRYSYSAYGSGKSQSRSVASASGSGGIGNLFFWDEPKKQSVAADVAPEQSQASQDATKDDSELEAKPFAKKVAEEPTKKPAKKIREASSNSEEPSEAAAPKKKPATPAPAKAKTAEPPRAAASLTPADPEVSPAMMAVPDPVKPSHAASAKASASGDDIADVQKASVQVQ
jgi:lipoprotein-anchoring transpeptidase ErfK/SrfK